MSDHQQYRPGDEANGYVLGRDGQWRPIPQQPQPQRNWFARHKVITGILALVAFMLVIGALSGGGDDTEAGVITSSPTATASATTAPPKAVAPSPTKAAPAKPKMTVAQEQAIKSANSYIRSGHFSKAGLLRQLTSEYGEGHTTADAQFALAHITVDYKAEAVEAAESYLRMGGFSKANLLRQLTSQYGEQFTKAEAEYAVAKVGL